MPADDLLAPVAYSWWIPALGGALLVLVACWYALVLLTTRRRRSRRGRQMPARQRRTYTDDVIDLYASYQRDDIDLRELHLALARTMRNFASERLARDVRPWTAQEVAEHDPTARVGDLLEVWEEPSFARRSDAEAIRARDGALEVMQRW